MQIIIILWILTQQGLRIKTDKRDARLIAQCLCYGGYHPVYIPTGEDDTVKEYPLDEGRP